MNVEAPDYTGVDRVPVGLGEPRAGWGRSPCGGIYYTGASSRPRVAFIATHYNLDFSEHYLADHLARRGFGFLAFNTRFCGMEAYFLLEYALRDIDAGVAWLREQGAEVVVLLGNSGGGSLMAAYQATHAGGDLYVSVAAHPGRPEVVTAWMDPAVVDEREPTLTEPELDMYDPANGPPYSDEFIARYRAAQVARNERITEWSKRHDNRLFTFTRTWADLRMVDGSIDPSDRPTPACYMGDPAVANRGTFGIGALCTTRTWLDMWSLGASKCRSSEHLGTITVPSLVVQATRDTGVFPSDAQLIHDQLGAGDKQLLHMPGDHYFRDVPGTPRADVADLITAWVEERT